MSTASSHHIHTNPITAAASSALARDVPGVSKYNPLTRSRVGKDKSSPKDEMPEYRSRMEIAIAGGMAGSSGDTDVEFLRRLENISEVATLEQRWTNSWTLSMLSKFVSSLSFMIGLTLFQRLEAASDSSPLEKIQALPNLSTYFDQTRTETPVCKVQNQARSC
jgi:dynactin-4